MHRIYIWILSIWFSAILSQSSADKHNYNIELTKVEIKYMTEEYFGRDTYFLIVALNDTKNVLESVIQFVKPPPDVVAIKLLVDNLDKGTNQWVNKVSQSHPFCDFIKDNHYLMDNLYRDSDFPKACPIQAGTYHIRNMYIDNSEFPENLVDSKWRVQLELVEKRGAVPIPLLEIHIDAEIITMQAEEEEEEEE